MTNMVKKALHKSGEAQKRAAYAVGHLQGVAKMLSEGRYCIDVIKQLEAVEGSVKKLKQTILANHLHNCVVDTVRNGTVAARAKAVEELLEVYKTEN